MSVAPPRTGTGAPPAATAREARAERKRQRILEAAASCFAENGFSGATVEAIAARAGMTKPTLYVHFEGKEQLFDEVLERTFVEWYESTASEVRRRAKGARQSIEVMHRASLEYARGKPVLRAFLEGDPRLLPLESDGVIRRALEMWRAAVGELLEAGIAAGELRQGLDIPRVTDLVILLNLTFIRGFFRPTHINASDPQLIEAGVDFILAAISAGGVDGR